MAGDIDSGFGIGCVNRGAVIWRRSIFFATCPRLDALSAAHASILDERAGSIEFNSWRCMCNARLDRDVTLDLTFFISLRTSDLLQLENLHHSLASFFLVRMCNRSRQRIASWVTLPFHTGSSTHDSNKVSVYLHVKIILIKGFG